MGNIKELFGKNYKALSQKGISDITGSATPVESSDYIDSYLKRKEKFLPPVNFATASNFAKFGSAEQYAEDAIARIYQTYPYDGSLAEKIDWFNRSNFYDTYLFNHRYPRTCGYAVFSPDGWGTLVGSQVNTFGLSNSPEYIQVKGGPHSDPNSGSLRLPQLFPEPWDGKANVWDNTTGVGRTSNLALDLDNGIAVEFWLKKPSYIDSDDTGAEMVFDLWNGHTGATEGDSYGRFTISGSTTTQKLYASVASGSLFEDLTFSDTINTAVNTGGWNHIALTAKQVQDSDNDYYIEWNEFLNGNFVKTTEDATATAFGDITGSLIANVGAARLPARTQAQAAASNVQTLITAGTNDGYGKLSGSIDEFRYWKTARTAKEISRFWFTQIGGGTNTDSSKFSGSAQPVDLGVYYKFNEGNTGDDTVDVAVLDYSGRISNGAWTGFISGSSRVAGPTSSAMIESSAAATEFKDPIIYSTHPEVGALSSSLAGEGLEWDLSNNMALYHTMPEWITSEDQDNQGKVLKKLTQIIASYLDTMYLQIQAVPTLGNIQYPYEELIVHDPDEEIESKTASRPYSNSPVPFARHQLEGMGMHAPEIFVAANELAQLANRDEYKEFDQKLYDIKNTIYQNIYNNLVYIYKSKGTEKAFRNLIRCFGVDDELIKINLYADGTTYRLDDSSYRSTSIKSNYIDFNHTDRNQGTLYQSSSLGTEQNYIAGDNFLYSSTAAASGSTMTFELDVIFPLKFERTHPSNLWYYYPYLTSSLFGCHTTNRITSGHPMGGGSFDFSWAPGASNDGDKASFQVYALRDEEDSKDVRFMLTSSYDGIPTLISDTFKDVYDNERWLFAVKARPTAYPLEGLHVSGSGANLIGATHVIEFQGYNPSLDQFQNSFSLSGTLTAADGAAFMNSDKRIYAGAHHQDFSGSLLGYTDIKVGAVRVWNDYLNDSEIKTHAIDPTNFGREHAYRSTRLFNHSDDPNLDSTFIPQFETLLLNWDFAQITGSSAGAVDSGPGSGGYPDHYGGSDYNSSFNVVSVASGSDDKWEVASEIKGYYPGRGDYFLPSQTNVVDSNFLYAATTNLPEIMSGQDTISILDTDDNYFTRDSKPINHYFAIEKSMYQAISGEMLNMFATATEFNNIIGEPVNRYRQEYKSLGKLREAFFRKVTNTPDFNRFVDFYRWVDDSLTVMLMQLVPATANFSDGVKTMIESHILERNKYWTKFPTLEMKAEPPTGFVKGIRELTYNWRYGHAPAPPTTHATGACDLYVNTASVLHGKYFQITSTDGTVCKYVFANNATLFGATGEVKAAGPPKEIWVQIEGMSDRVDFEEQLRDAINHSNGHGGKIGAWLADNKVQLKQTVPGVAGNTLIDDDISIGYGDNTDFSGGSDNEKDNCLWWKERGEASASFTAGNQTDTDRNTLRRILTSDVTTNKILATGEYTDPTDYPNSGFPNAAQFNLSQDGNEYNARTQYKGSTYALRALSKPYKLDLEKSRHIHGGMNVPMNNKGIDYLWATHRGIANAATNLSTVFNLEGALVGGDADYNLKADGCSDNVKPIELRKIKRSSETQPYATADQADAIKSMLVSPFQYFSQSSDITTARATLDTDTAYNNLHDDSYGESNETPMQGPFTQAHVGGRQYRHLAASSSFLGTNHNDQNRAEGFRIAAAGETVYSPKATDAGAAAPQNAAGLYYRDEVAKRPLNIKNIQSTTASNALGNYDRLSQIVTTNADESTFYAKLQAAHASDGLHSLLSGTSSPVVSDTHDYAKLRAVGKTVLDSSTLLTAPYDSTQVDPYISRHTIIERFSAPGGPDTAGDAFGGFGIDREANRYSVYNALPWRNLAVRTPLNAMQTTHCAAYGALPNSTLSATEATTALTASFHKTPRNTDYDIRQTPTLTAYRSNSVYFGGSTSDQFYRDDTNIDGLTKMTLSVWFKQPNTNAGTIFSWSSSFYIRVINNKIIVTIFGNTGWLWFSTPANSIKDDQWHHMAFALDQGETQQWRTNSLDYATMLPSNRFFPKLWIDGKLVEVTPSQSTSWTGFKQGYYLSNICVGTWYKANTVAPVEGYIQDISLWNDILTDDQVKDLYRLPGYESFGPGDLNRLKYVSADEDSNKLHAWWQFNHATDINDVAPIGNNLHLDGHNGTPAVNTTAGNFLPANYHATDCLSTHDNWFIQHPIPANEFGYAWITASANKDTGCDLLTTASFVTASDIGSYQVTAPIRYYAHQASWSAPYAFIPNDFVGLNTNLYEPISASSNILGYPSFNIASTTNWNYQGGMTTHIRGANPSGSGLILNGLLHHRNGPYQHPTWKQIRTGEHPVARYHKRNNIISVSDKPTTRTLLHKNTTQEIVESKASTHTNYYEPAVSTRHNPITHRIESLADGVPQSLTLRYTHGNNIVNFANPELNNAVSFERLPRQLYDDFKDNYLAPSDHPAANPVKVFKSLSYKETIYPKESRAFLSKARSRLSYAETAAVMSSSANGTYRTFWRDALADRRRDDGAVNSMGYHIFKDTNQAYDYAGGFSDDEVDQGLYYLGTGSLSIWPLDTGANASRRPVATYSGLPGLDIEIDEDLPLNDVYGGTWGELHSRPEASIWASMNTADLGALGGGIDAALHATGSITFVSNTPAHYDGKTITIITGEFTEAITRIFEFNESGDGDKDTGDSPSTNVYVQINGLSARDDIAAQFLLAIEHANGFGTVNGTEMMWALQAGRNIYLTQTGSGPTGHTVIALGGGLDADEVTYNNFAGGTHFMNDDNFKCPGTASVCFNHWGLSAYDPGAVYYVQYGNQAVTYTDIISSDDNYDNVGGGKQIANWSTHLWSGRNPGYDSYEAYSSDIRNMGQDYTIIPEFKISDHMDFYIDNSFEERNFKFLSLEGASYTSSADAYTSDYNEPFWQEYCHSEFMEVFNVIQRDHEGVAAPSVISLKCSAVKKLLPYNGFYPVQRTLQLASLFSSSYGPYISGSSAASYGLQETSIINENGRDKYFAERLQSVLQPFYAPGIMYNTIKSGIAVDYPIHTSSAELRCLGGRPTAYPVGTQTTATPTKDRYVSDMNIDKVGSVQCISSAPDMRMPFEALINPDRYLPVLDDVVDTISDQGTAGRMYLTATSFGTSSFYATWGGVSKPHYKLAANNFAAEVPNFFLKNKTFTTFRSAPEKEFKAMASGSTYYMDVVLQKSPDMIMNHHGGWAYSTYGIRTGWGYGPSYLASTGAIDLVFSDVNQPDQPKSWLNSGDPSFAPHVPPYFYGRAVARLAFTPHEHADMPEGTSLTFTLEDIMTNARLNSRTEYTSELGTGIMPFMSESVQVLKEYPTSPAAQNQMHVSSSVNLFGKTHTPAVQYGAAGEPISADEGNSSPTWVIHSKFECPALNFATTTGGGYAPEEDPANGGSGIPALSASWWTETVKAKNFPAALWRPVGMWNGYGQLPTGETGIFMGLRESFPAQVYGAGESEFGLTGSLLQTCGFKGEQRKIGEMATAKVISEAVVAIPFVDVEGRRKFFALGNTKMQSQALYSMAASGEGNAGRSIRTMARRMKRYVFPPHMDFSTNGDIEPFAMYIFEFHHKLSQKDLINIWQNVLPDIGVTAKKTTTVLTHELGKNEFFSGQPIPKHTRWMVFKVKMKAEKDYFKVTADTTDDHQFKFDFAQGGHKAIPDYSYNWPYDYFSLVELAKIETKVGVGDDAFPVVPPWNFSDAIIGRQSAYTLASGKGAAHVAAVKGLSGTPPAKAAAEGGGGGGTVLDGATIDLVATEVADHSMGTGEGTSMEGIDIGGLGLQATEVKATMYQASQKNEKSGGNVSMAKTVSASVKEFGQEYAYAIAIAAGFKSGGGIHYTQALKEVSKLRNHPLYLQWLATPEGQAFDHMGI